MSRDGDAAQLQPHAKIEARRHLLTAEGRSATNTSLILGMPLEANNAQGTSNQNSLWHSSSNAQLSKHRTLKTVNASPDATWWTLGSLRGLCWFSCGSVGVARRSSQACGVCTIFACGVPGSERIAPSPQPTRVHRAF